MTGASPAPSAARAPEQAIIAFEAACVVCSANGRLILRNERERMFRLASMQHEASADLPEPADRDRVL